MSHPLPKTYLRIHAPHTHTCTTKNIYQDTCTTYTYMHCIHIHAPLNITRNKICLVWRYLCTLYERPNQNERFLLNNMFLVHFTEMQSALQWNVQFMKSAAHFSEIWSAFHWNAQTHWNALCFSLKCGALRFSDIFDELLGSHQV